MGRFYSMDRNKLWKRTELAYNAIVAGEGVVVPNAHTAILRGYNRGESGTALLSPARHTSRVSNTPLLPTIT
jgi:bisphosphoglycerate-independent phosphoglycerate mutase (AlkP superfamily)